MAKDSHLLKLREELKAPDFYIHVHILANILRKLQYNGQLCTADAYSLLWSSAFTETPGKGSISQAPFH